MVSREHTITMPEAVVIALPREAWNHRELFAKAVPESRYGVKRCAAILAVLRPLWICRVRREKVLRPLWICRVRREKVFVHCEFAEYAAKKFSSIVDLQSAPRKSFRPLWICRVRREKKFVHCRKFFPIAALQSAPQQFHGPLGP
jgi:hypothetical protein